MPDGPGHGWKHMGLLLQPVPAAWPSGTLQQDDKAFFMKVQDNVRGAVDEARFMLSANKMKEAAQIPLEHDPVQEVFMPDSTV